MMRPAISSIPVSRNAEPTTSAAPSPAAVLDALPAAVFVADADGRIRYRNASAHRDHNAGETLTESLGQLRLGNGFAGWNVELAAVLKEGPTRRFDAIAAGGPHHSRGGAFPTHRVYSITLAPLGETGTALIQIAPAAALGDDDRGDIALRLTSLGKMAARVAHELNNPLDGILRYTNMALRLAGDVPEPRIKSYLHESRTGLLRMIEIIGDLLEYSRATAGAFDELGINEVVEQAIRSSADRASGAGVIITADFQTMHMPAVRGGRLYQVCCNLIRNAIDAMPDGGRLTITTGRQARPERTQQQQGRATAARAAESSTKLDESDRGPAVATAAGGSGREDVDADVIIRFADTGVGLPNPISKVFEPFYTTKPPGKGTGLGLAICKDFVESLGGTLAAERGETRGAVFTIRIPVARCTPPAPARFATDSNIESP